MVASSIWLYNDKIKVMNKKKIFFLLGAMNVGGVENSFFNLLALINPLYYDVHLGLLKIKGESSNKIPDWVHIHYIDVYDRFYSVINDAPRVYIKEMIRAKQWKDVVLHIMLYMHYRLTGTRYFQYRYFMRNEPVMPDVFDLAIAYAGPSQHIDYYICEKVKARVKCGWIHFDISKFGIDYGMTKRLYKKYTRIFCVSQTAKDIFDKTFPMLKDRTEVFYNVVNPVVIREQANAGDTFSDSFDGKRILTVGRISNEKGQLEAIEALAFVLKQHIHVKWYFVGDGKFRKVCEERARELGVSDNVEFLGTKVNPYPFMKDCDVYVQPSRHEGYCITLAEARVFGMPIVATDFTGACEQLALRTNAFVTGMSSEEMAQGIIQACQARRIENVILSDLPQTDINALVGLI